MLGLGSVGNIGALIGSVLTLGIAAIVLLTFAPQITGDVDGMFLQTKPACGLAGERFTQVVEAGTGAADAQWLRSGGGVVTQLTQAVCEAAADNTLASYTPRGTKIGSAGAANTVTGVGGEWKPPSSALNALGGGTLIQLLFGAMAILIPAGAIGFLAYSGASMLQDRIEGGTLAVAIGTTVTVVVIGAILPEIFTPLDNLFNILDGHRFVVFSNGIGRLAGVLGNFMGISLIGGLVALGAMLWKNTRTDAEKAY